MKKAASEENSPVHTKTGRFFAGFYGIMIKEREGIGPFPLLMGVLLVTSTGCPVVAQFEGRALGLAALAHFVSAVPYLDLIEGAALIFVVGAAVHRTLDTGIGLINHGHFLLVSRWIPGYKKEYAPPRGVLCTYVSSRPLAHNIGTEVILDGFTQ